MTYKPIALLFIVFSFPLLLLSPVVSALTGGPDLYGHFWSDELPFAWIPTTQGTNLEIEGNDGWFGPFPIGFEFSWYGIRYNSYYISPNGSIAFEHNTTSITTCIDYSANGEEAFITIGGDRKLSQEYDGWCKTILTGTAPDQRRVIEFNNLQKNPYSSQVFDVEIVLYENNGSSEKCIIAVRNVDTLTDTTAYIGGKSADTGIYIVYRDGCSEGTGIGNNLANNLAVAIYRSESTHCIRLSADSVIKLQETNSWVDYRLTVVNCGALDAVISLSSSLNSWAVTILDMENHPITEIAIPAKTSGYFKVRVFTPAEPGSDIVRITTTTIDDRALDSIELTTKALLYFNSFDTDPTLSNWEFDSPNWEWREATESSCGSGGSDPKTDTSQSGNDYLIGYLPGDCYPNNLMESDYCATPAFDFTGLAGIHLLFNRWLGIASNLEDHATIQASNDGNTWQTVWENPQTLLVDHEWLTQEVDISQIANDESEVRIRFALGPTDATNNWFGWNIDDFGFMASPAGYLVGAVAGWGGLLTNAIVTIQQTGNEQTTGSDGMFRFALPAGTYTALVQAPFHAAQLRTSISISATHLTTENFILDYPELEVAPESYSPLLTYGQVDLDVCTLTNSGSSELTFLIELQELSRKTNDSRAPAWLYLSDYDGSVLPAAGGNSYEISVTFDATMVPAPGNYSADILIHHNAHNGNGLLIIPVAMQVTATYFAQFTEETLTGYGAPGSAIMMKLLIRNSGSSADAYNVSVQESDWDVTFPNNPDGYLQLEPGESALLLAQISIPSQTVEPGDMDTALLSLYSRGAQRSIDTITLITYAAQSIPWSTDFEANDGNCEALNPGSPSSQTIWSYGTVSPQQGPGNAHSGSKCWGTGRTTHYENNMYTILQTPPLLLPDSELPNYLDFFHWYSFEPVHDGGWVEIETELQRYPLRPFHGYPPGTQLFTGDSASWQWERYDLSAFRGQVVRLSWVALSDTSVHNYPGWFIDDITITHTEPAIPALTWWGLLVLIAILTIYIRRLTSI